MGRTGMGVVQEGKPWFASSSEPGSSAGSSAMEETEAERGRLGRGFCTDADLEKADVLDTGERNRSFNAVWRLVAALTKASLYWSMIGLESYCCLPGGRIVRFGHSVFGVV